MAARRPLRPDRPAPLAQVIEGRAARLGERARDLLGVAAVIGQEVALDVWASVVGVDEGALLATVTGAQGAGLLGELPDGTGVRFAHALIREALYEGTLAARRRRLHLRAGRHWPRMRRPTRTRSPTTSSRRATTERSHGSSPRERGHGRHSHG